ncbi:MAG: coenzyme F420-0:L-glutamate ligase [Gammaproteobacteria bacterium]
MQYTTGLNHFIYGIVTEIENPLIMNNIELKALEDFPYVEPGDDLAKIILKSFRINNINLDDGDVVVVAQKIISKSENRYIDLNKITPSEKAITLAKELNRDSSFIQVILNESNEIVSTEKNVIIVEHKLGFININAGIDRSNIPQDINQVLLLPKNPTISANNLRLALSEKFKKQIAVVITDSMTRPYRSGVTNFALASSNLQSLIDLSGEKDMYGNILKNTEIAIADEIAAASGLLMGQGSDKKPVVIIKGFNKNKYKVNDALDLVVSREDDLYR